MNENDKNSLAQEVALACSQATVKAARACGGLGGDCISMTVSGAAGALMGTACSIFKTIEDIDSDHFLFVCLLAARATDFVNHTKLGAAIAVSFEPALMIDVMADFQKMTGRVLWDDMKPDLRKLVEATGRFDIDRDRFGKFVLN
jgi:hypothetical protein